MPRFHQPIPGTISGTMRNSSNPPTRVELRLLQGKDNRGKIDPTTVTLIVPDPERGGSEDWIHTLQIDGITVKDLFQALSGLDILSKTSEGTYKLLEGGENDQQASGQGRRR